MEVAIMDEPCVLEVALTNETLSQYIAILI